MLHIELNVQGSDTTMLNSSNTVKFNLKMHRINKNSVKK